MKKKILFIFITLFTIIHINNKYAVAEDACIGIVAESKISEDNKAIGWIVKCPVSFVSYPLPLKLHVFRNNKTIEIKGEGISIWEWHFIDGGNKVALYQDYPHGEPHYFYTLYDIENDKTLDTWSINDTKLFPNWANIFKNKPARKKAEQKQ